jgi:type I restriction enzyme S subunit
MKPKEKNLPTLRFPEFEGEWDVITIRDFCELISGFAFNSESFGSIGQKLITPKNFTKFGFASFTIENTKYTTEIVDGKFLCAEGDLLILLTDLTPSCELLGKPVLLTKNDGEVLLNQRIVKLKMDATRVDKLFLSNFLLTKNYQKRIRETATGSTVRHSSNKILTSIEFCLPSLVEQQRIGAFLSATNEKIGQLDKKKDLLLQYKKAVMQRIFSQQIRFKDDNGNDYPDWKEKPISSVCRILYGKDQRGISAVDGIYPILGTGGIIGKTNQFLYDKPSVLIGRKGTIDRPRYMDTPFWTVDTLFYTEVFETSIPKWLFYQFEMINWYRFNEASGVPSLSATTISKIKIQVPDKSEQEKIVTFLSALDTRVRLVDQQLERMKTFKRGLVQQMFV